MIWFIVGVVAGVAIGGLSMLIYVVYEITGWFNR